jgi:hypothetical protein
MTESETEILDLIVHIETYVDPTNLVILNERQRKLIVNILDGYTANSNALQPALTSSPPPLIAPHNPGERLPSSDAAKSGGDPDEDEIALVKKVAAAFSAGKRFGGNTLFEMLAYTAIRTIRRDLRRSGMDAAFHEVADQLQHDGLDAYARFFRSRASALSPQKLGAGNDT